MSLFSTQFDNVTRRVDRAMQLAGKVRDVGDIPAAIKAQAEALEEIQVMLKRMKDVLESEFDKAGADPPRPKAR